MKKSRFNHNKPTVISTVLLCLLLAAVMAPFYIMLVGAFKPNASLITIPADLIPVKGFTLKNIQIVFEKSEILLWLKNSMIVSVSVAIATAFIGVTAGYAFAKINFKGKNILFMMVMATMMMPKQMLLIPNYLVAYNLKLQDTMIGLILTSIAPAFGVFLSRQFITSLPGTLFEAAEIDGCSEIGKFFRIALPLSLPSVGTISIFAFFSCFNDYIWQLIMISDKELKTLPVGIAFFSEQMLNNRAAQMAIAMLATIPMVIIFLACQKFFIKGATAGAVKG